MYCRHCGKQISDEAIMCPDCGAPTKPVKVTPPQEPNIEKPVSDDKKSFFNSLGIVGFVLSIYALIAYLLASISYFGTGITSGVIPAALTGVSIGIVCIKHATGTHRVLAIVGMGISGFVILLAMIFQIVYMSM